MVVQTQMYLSKLDELNWISNEIGRCQVRVGWSMDYFHPQNAAQGHTNIK